MESFNLLSNVQPAELLQGHLCDDSEDDPFNDYADTLGDHRNAVKIGGTPWFLQHEVYPHDLTRWYLIFQNSPEGDFPGFPIDDAVYEKVLGPWYGCFY